MYAQWINPDRLGARVGKLRAGASVLVLNLIAAGSLLAQEEHGAASGGGGLFDINWINLMVWTWLIFIVLLFVLRKWAWGPILGALNAREERIQEALDSAAREREEAARLLQEHRDLLDGSRDEAQKILAESRKAGERLRTELLDEARKQREQIVDRAREDIERERDHALEALRREAVDLSISAAGRVLNREVDSAENRRLVEEYLAGLAADRKSGEGD